MTTDEIDELYLEQLGPLASIVQQLAISTMPNAQYSAILLEHSKDVKEQRAKIVDKEGQDNVDEWLNGSAEFTFDEALQFLRQEYLTILGSNAKDLSPSQIYEAINDVYKSHIKSMHQFGKGIDSLPS